MATIEKTFIQFGIRSDWAQSYAAKKLSATTFRNTPAKALIERYGIPSDQVKLVKVCLSRLPVDPGIVEELLNNNRYVCCLCRGEKSKAYIIHHITEYSVSQDNNYGNLAVLCPDDHDLAHREGQMLTQKINADQVRKGKWKWETKVQELDVQAACREGKISEIDFINIPRVVSLYQKTFQASPASPYESWLHDKGIITPTGELSESYLATCDRNSFNLFMSGPNGGWQISQHYSEGFMQLLKSTNFTDLDDLLAVRKLKQGVIGKPCFYVGGLYGKMPDLPLTATTKPVELYFRRKNFWVSWLVDPNYMVSVTALTRLADHNVYQVYGSIRNIKKRKYKDKEYWHIDIRPYLFGTPTIQKLRARYFSGVQEVDDDAFE